jgi:hypothetical protein
MEKECGAKVGYSSEVHFYMGLLKPWNFFQLWLFRICAPNALKVAIEFISWAMVCNHLVMDASLVYPWFII